MFRTFQRGAHHKLDMWVDNSWFSWVVFNYFTKHQANTIEQATVFIWYVYFVGRNFTLSKRSKGMRQAKSRSSLRRHTRDAWMIGSSIDTCVLLQKNYILNEMAIIYLKFNSILFYLRNSQYYNWQIFLDFQRCKIQFWHKLT